MNGRVLREGDFATVCVQDARASASPGAVGRQLSFRSVGRSAIAVLRFAPRNRSRFDRIGPECSSLRVSPLASNLARVRRGAWTALLPREAHRVPAVIRLAHPLHTPTIIRSIGM